MFYFSLSLAMTIWHSLVELVVKFVYTVISNYSEWKIYVVG